MTTVAIILLGLIPLVIFFLIVRSSGPVDEWEPEAPPAEEPYASPAEDPYAGIPESPWASPGEAPYDSPGEKPYGTS